MNKNEKSYRLQIILWNLCIEFSSGIWIMSSLKYYFRLKVTLGYWCCLRERKQPISSEGLLQASLHFVCTMGSPLSLLQTQVLTELISNLSDTFSSFLLKCCLFMPKIHKCDLPDAFHSSPGTSLIPAIYLTWKYAQTLVIYSNMLSMSPRLTLH